jgi:hypothetical protein
MEEQQCLLFIEEKPGYVSCLEKLHLCTFNIWFWTGEVFPHLLIFVLL